MFWYPKDTDYDVKDMSGVTLMEFLDAYDPGKYERPAVTVDNLVFKKEDDRLMILLIRRGRHPSYDMLGLPGGFIEMNETLEESAARELLEETGVTGVPLVQLGAYGDVGRDPRLRIISVAYMAVITKDVGCKAGDDAAEAGFFAVTVKKTVNFMETIYELKFENDSCTGSARIVETGGKRVIAASDLASDHALMILDGLQRLGFVDNM